MRVANFKENEGNFIWHGKLIAHSRIKLTKISCQKGKKNRLAQSFSYRSHLTNTGNNNHTPSPLWNVSFQAHELTKVTLSSVNHTILVNLTTSQIETPLLVTGQKTVRKRATRLSYRTSTTRQSRLFWIFIKIRVDIQGRVTFKSGGFYFFQNSCW